MKVYGEKIHRRVRIIYLILIGGFAMLMIRVGYIQLIYQNNIVTFAQIDQQAKLQNSEIIDEVKNSFKINLDQFREVNAEGLILSGKTDAETLSLLDTLTDVCEKGCTGQPSAFLYETKGYILLKNSQEEDVLIEINKQKNRWSETSIQKAK